MNESFIGNVNKLASSLPSGGFQEVLNELSPILENMIQIIAVKNNEPNINAVNANEPNINALALITNILESLYADRDKLRSLVLDKPTLDSLYADKPTLDGLRADKATLDSLHADKQTLDGLRADKAVFDALFLIKNKLESLFDNLGDIGTNAQNIAAIQGALQNATDAINAKNTALTYRNQAEGFKNEAQAIAGGTIVASNVQFSDLLSLETYRTNTQDTISAIQTLLTSNDTSFDEIQELVDFIKANKATLDTLAVGNIAGLQTALDAKSTEIASHANNAANPHDVNKAQVGLSNVDNTSDELKPLSEAANTALNLKADKTETYTKTEVDILVGDSFTLAQAQATALSF